jgi:hypothetical protein
VAEGATCRHYFRPDYSVGRSAVRTDDLSEGREPNDRALSLRSEMETRRYAVCGALLGGGEVRPSLCGRTSRLPPSDWETQGVRRFLRSARRAVRAGLPCDGPYSVGVFRCVDGDGW